MLKCSLCGKTTDTVTLTGAIVTGSIPIGVRDGAICAVGPLQPHCMVKDGTHVTQLKKFVAQCSACGHTSPLSEFKIVALCIFSGEEVDTYVELANGTRVPCASQYRQLVLGISYSTGMYKGSEVILP